MIRSPLVSEDFTFDGIAGVDEFVLKPVFKSTTPAEIGVELELKWILSNEADLDTVILVLLSVMSKKGISAKDLVCQVKSQGVSTPVEDLVYPGRPINMWGMVMHGDDLASTMIHLHDLYDEDYSVRVILGEEHRLGQIAKSLWGRTVYVLGLVQSTKEMSIEAGAVLI